MSPIVRSSRRSRRGMLLLLVLSMLTLFLLMGSLALVLAMRARESARAFAKVSSGSSSRSAAARPQLNEALLVLIRGTQSPQAKQAITENLLGDMFGSPPGAVPFAGEAHDAVESDAFLTGYRGDRPPDVDNDGDGQPEGVWLTDVLPPLSTADGGRMTFRVSYLVQDLDGRINVNAHGTTDANVPLGPASVDASDIFSTAVWQRLMSNGTITRTSTVPTQAQWRPAPAIGGGTTVEGRFGRNAASTYAIRLDRDAPRPGMVSGAAAANPFTPGELERVLRPFDTDAATLPPRLAAILDNKAEDVRPLVTTDSWDTTGKTGRAARALAAPELRFDLNRAIADDAAKQQYAADLLAVCIQAGAAADDDTRKWVGKVADARARQPFTSVGELLTIPIDDVKKHSLVGPRTPGEGILEAVTVPSPFTATLAANPWREPGRVNVNTCDDRVWRAVCGKDGVNRPGRPITSLWQLLTETAGGRDDAATVNKDLANRLAAIATVRSNVFAVWITVEITDSSSAAFPPTCHRLFAIVDRSIPVRYVEGQNNDVRETIRVRRFLD